jgi:hypothetical protein
MQPLFFDASNQLFQNRVVRHINQGFMLVLIKGRADAYHHFIHAFIRFSRLAFAHL